MASKSKTATFYLQLEAQRNMYAAPDVNGETPISGVKAVRITQARPNRPVPGTVIVKLEVEIPVSVFAPLSPEARIVIPEQLTHTVPVEVTAIDPANPAATFEDD